MQTLLFDKVIDEQGQVKTAFGGSDSRLYYYDINGDRIKYLLQGETADKKNITPLSGNLSDTFDVSNSDIVIADNNNDLSSITFPTVNFNTTTGIRTFEIWIKSSVDISSIAFPNQYSVINPDIFPDNFPAIPGEDTYHIFAIRGSSTSRLDANYSYSTDIEVN